MSEHLGCYGEKVAKTPILDQLASEGIRYTNFYATAGVCAPSRSAIITGMHQQTIGTQHMRTLAVSLGTARDPYPPNFKPYSAVLPENVKCFPEYLRESGYYCTNNSKEDYQFQVPPTVWDESSKNAHWRNRKDNNQPFFSVFNLMITHESQVFERAKEPLLVNPEDVIVPPYYPDVPEVRKDIAIFLSNVMKMDKQVGIILAELKEDGLLENTIIFFFSDHGDGLPFAKREVYDRGLRVPLIVKFPTKNAQIIDSQLHSFVDLAPTILSLANIPIRKNMQGQAFLGNQKTQKERKYIFAARDRMGSVYDRVRAVRDQKYKYIKNYMPEKPLYQDIPYRLQLPMMQTILKLKDEGKLKETQLKWFVPSKPKEELYDCHNDYFELNNLADIPEFQEKLKELRKEHEDFTKKYGDMGEQNEMEMVSKWWGGNQYPPKTQDVKVEIKNEKCKLTSLTTIASIGYKNNAKSTWKVYTKPFSMQKGDSLYTIAQRIGYKKSEIVKMVW